MCHMYSWIKHRYLINRDPSLFIKVGDMDGEYISIRLSCVPHIVFFYKHRRKRGKAAMKKSNVRLISFSDGTTMGDYLYIVSTNAPKEELKELERISCKLYRNGHDESDIPVWADELEEKGYIFDILDSHQHISQYRSSREWKAEKYPEVNEHYQIENQIRK